MKGLSIFFAVFVLILTGCSENKVTADYLIGSWNCTFTDFHFASTEDGKLSDLRQVLDRIGDKYLYEISKKDKLLSIKVFYEGKPLGSIDSTIEDLMNSEEITKYYKHRVTTEFLYVSNNQFDHITTMSDFDILENSLLHQIKSESTCDRVI